MEKKIQVALGPYSLYLRVPATKNLVFLAGKIGHNQKTNSITAKTFGEEVKQALENLDAVLKEAGLKRDNVVQCRVFLTDMKDFEPMNKIYIEFFGQHRPTRTCVAVKQLPKRALFEIEATCAE